MNGLMNSRKVCDSSSSNCLSNSPSGSDSQPHFISAVTTLADGNLVPVPGGVLIRDESGTVIGAVGVSGHLPDDDEDCAVWGITACSLLADPGE